MFGVVPSIFRALPESTIELEWNLMKRVQMDEGPIPNKYRELIGAGISAISKCRYSAYRPASGHRHQIIPQIYRKVFVTNGRIAVCFGAMDAIAGRLNVSCSRSVTKLRTESGLTGALDKRFNNFCCLQQLDVRIK